MDTKPAKPVPLYKSLSDESTGECPCGCGRTAYAYATPAIPDATPAIPDGYVDAAPACVLKLLIGEGHLTQAQVDTYQAELVAYRVAVQTGVLP